MQLIKSFFVASLVLAGTVANAHADNRVDRIEFEISSVEIVEFSSRLVRLNVLNGQPCNATLPGQLGNCALDATLHIDEVSAGLDACFLVSSGCTDDPISVGVGAPVSILVTSLSAAPATPSLRLLANFENVGHSSSTATLHVAVVPPPFLTGPSSLRVVRGATSTAPFAAEHPGGTATVAVGFANVANGLTATATPASLPVGIDTTAIAVGAAATLAAGSYGLDVISSVAGFASETDHVTAVVVDPIAFAPQLSGVDLFGIRVGTSPKTVAIDVTREPGVTGAITYAAARNLFVSVAIATHGDDVTLTLTRTGLATSGSTTTVLLRGTVGGVTSEVRLPIVFP